MCPHGGVHGLGGRKRWPRVGWGDADLLRTAPLSARGHPVRHLALRQVHAQLPGRRRAPGRARLEVSYETIRRWVLKFGPAIARRLRRRRPQPTGHWHLDEMV